MKDEEEEMTNRGMKRKDESEKSTFGSELI